MIASPQGPRPLIGLTLLGVAALLALLAVIGVLDLAIGALLGRLWPLLLIGFGLDLLLGRQVRRLHGGLALLLAFALSGWVLASSGWPGTVATEPEHFDRNGKLQVVAAGAQEARLKLVVDAQQLRIGALDASRDLLVAGNVGGPNAASVDYTVDDGVGKLDLEATSPLNPLGSGEWSLLLNRTLPLQLAIEAGASDLDLDLRELRLQEVSLETGASSVRLRLPEGAATVQIDAGVSSLVVELPAQAAARINLDAGASDVRVAPRFQPQGDGVYATAGADEADEVIMIAIDAGAASIEIK